MYKIEHIEWQYQVAKMAVKDLPFLSTIVDEWFQMKVEKNSIINMSVLDKEAKQYLIDMLSVERDKLNEQIENIYHSIIK